MIVNKSDKLLDLETLIYLLLSKDIDKYDDIKKMIFGKTSRYLNGVKNMNISYTSYPRSGNTFLRKYFESILGVATGSDMVMIF